MLVDRFEDQEAIEEKVIKLVNVGVPFFLVHFKDGILISCDDLYERNRGRGSKGDAWWWNEELKVVDSRKREVQKAMCQISTEENKRRYKSIKNKAKKAVSKAMR